MRARALNGFDPLEFNGLQFDQIEAYREGLFVDADCLRTATAFSRAIGLALTRDLIERGYEAIRSIAPRRESPSFPKLFLYLLRDQNRFYAVDRVLDAALSTMTTSKRRDFCKRLRDAPDSSLAELAFFGAAINCDLTVRWFPAIPSTGKEADLALSFKGREIYVEVTALNQGLFWDNADEQAEISPSGVWSGAGPGFIEEANRVASKVSEELQQTAAGSANLLVVICTGVFPSRLGRGFGFDDALSGPRQVTLPSGRIIDYGHRVFLDSIFEYAGKHLDRCFISPECYQASRLTEEERLKLRTAFYQLPFTFP